MLALTSDDIASGRVTGASWLAIQAYLEPGGSWSFPSARCILAGGL
jgi:hypothetical protein